MFSAIFCCNGEAEEDWERDSMSMGTLAKDATEYSECSICMESLSADLGCLPCGHVFHSHCVLQWLESSNRPSCPQCRKACPRTSLTPLYFSVSEPSTVKVENLYSLINEDLDPSVAGVDIKEKDRLIVKYRRKAKKFEEMVSNSEKRHAELSTRFEMLSTQNSQVLAQLKDREVDNARLLAKKNELVSELRRSMAAVKESSIMIATNDFIKAGGEADEELKKMRRRFSEVEIAQIQISALQFYRREHSRLSEEIGKISERVPSLQRTADSLERQVSSLKEEKDGLRGELRQLRKKLAHQTAAKALSVPNTLDGTDGRRVRSSASSSVTMTPTTPEDDLSLFGDHTPDAPGITEKLELLRNGSGREGDKGSLSSLGRKGLEPRKTSISKASRQTSLSNSVGSSLKPSHDGESSRSIFSLLRPGSQGKPFSVGKRNEKFKGFWEAKGTNPVLAPVSSPFSRE